MQVAIIGAGPRGLAVAERLINLADDDTDLEIKIYDPCAIGGRVWNPYLSKNQSFLMNTVVGQITLFNDDSIVHGGKSVKGPSLFQWLQTDALAFLEKHPEFGNEYYDEVLRLKTPDDFATRGMMGVYANWFFDWLKHRVRKNHKLSFIQQQVNDITKVSDGFQLQLNDGTQILSNSVVMALGHSDNTLQQEEKVFADFASRNQLKYVAPTHPSEADLSTLSQKDNVIVRGLGLSFFDYLAELSIGKGGRFVREEENELVYHPSENEPHIIAGSRGGFPLHARGVNEKNESELYEPQFFTLTALDALRAVGQGHIKYQDFENLIVKEMTYKYLLNRLKQPDASLTYDQIEALKKALLKSRDLKATATSYGLEHVSEFDIELIRNPSRNLSKNVDYQKWMQSYLADDIRDARLGNKSAPFAGAFDIMRDMRDLVRYVVEQDYFSVEDYDLFLKRFKPLDGLISVGPPLERIEQLLALMKAGIVEIMAPGMQVKTSGTGFEALDNRGQIFKGNALIEARLGSNNIEISSNPLIANLKSKGILNTAVKQRKDGSKYPLGAANVDKQTFEVIQSDGQKIDNMYLYGITLEGLKWFGTVIPRPGVNTVILREAAWITQRILEQA